jgi:hypothetical protein
VEENWTSLYLFICGIIGGNSNPFYIYYIYKKKIKRQTNQIIPQLFSIRPSFLVRWFSSARAASTAESGQERETPSMRNFYEWLAGFIDAEGCFYIKNKYIFFKYTYIYIYLKLLAGVVPLDFRLICTRMISTCYIIFKKH